MSSRRSIKNMIMARYRKALLFGHLLLVSKAVFQNKHYIEKPCIDINIFFSAARKLTLLTSSSQLLSSAELAPETYVSTCMYTIAEFRAFIGGFQLSLT